MKTLLVDIGSFIALAALFVLNGYILIKRVQSRKKEDGGIQTLFGTKKPK
ncbi:MAG: hypothetical protein ABSB39_02385 [Candidatus Sulfotelmatobacter sp.]|jgi:hypothetical protein